MQYIDKMKNENISQLQKLFEKLNKVEDNYFIS